MINSGTLNSINANVVCRREWNPSSFASILFTQRRGNTVGSAVHRNHRSSVNVLEFLSDEEIFVSVPRLFILESNSVQVHSAKRLRKTAFLRTLKLPGIASTLPSVRRTVFSATELWRRADEEVASFSSASLL